MKVASFCPDPPDPQELAFIDYKWRVGRGVKALSAVKHLLYMADQNSAMGDILCEDMAALLAVIITQCEDKDEAGR